MQFKSVILALSFFVGLSTSSSRAAYSVDSSAYEFDTEELKPNSEIPFSNRAACAVDSKKAAQSVFLMVDSYNAGKQLNSWLQGSNTTTITLDQGLKLFRLTVTEVWMTLMQDILAGKLPILETSKIKQKCGNTLPCQELDQYLNRIFAQRTRNLNTEGTSRSFLTVDQFIDQSPIMKGRNHPQASCLYVKRFSELQSHWNQDRPDQALLQKIALASLSKNGLFTDCFDESDDLSSRRFILQVDLSEVSKRDWKKHGFDFWYSMKLYFSYAWRHTEVVLGNSDQPILSIFKNLAVEQMIQLISNGCESIEIPECTQSKVSMDIFRALGKIDSATELDKPLPDRPEQTLISGTLSKQHEDAALLPNNDETETWLKSYQERIIQRRGSIKQKLLLALAQFEMISPVLTSNKLQQELSVLKNQISKDQTLYRKMQVMCTELDIAFRPGVNLLDQRFQSTLKIEKFKKLAESASSMQLGQMIDFYNQSAKAAFPICESIRIEKLWKQDQPVSTTSYALWYRDLSGTWSAPVDQGQPASTDFLGMGDLFNQANFSNQPLLAQEKIESDGSKSQSTICSDATDCFRMILKSMVDLYAVSAWSDAMMPLNEWIQSPNLANPWASATACKVYDPWFATKQALSSVVTDLGMTITTGFVPAPIYLAAETKRREVKAFELQKQGDEILLKPIKKGAGVNVTFGVDLGPWIGVPCAGVISPTSNRPQIGGYYSIAGIRTESCGGKDNSRLIVKDSSASNENQKHSYSGCLMCYLNPYSAAQGVATLASYSVPLARIAVGTIFTGVSLVKRLNNPIDVPHRYRVDTEEVSKTFEKYSFIPKGCVRRLSKGRSCQQVHLKKDEKKSYQEHLKKNGES